MRILNRINALFNESHLIFFRTPAHGAITILSTALTLWLVVFASETLTTHYLVKKLMPVILQNSNDVFAIQMQIAATLKLLNDLPRNVGQCTKDIKKELRETTRTQRYIYASALKIDNGKACTSYGQSVHTELMPNAQQPNHYSSNGGVDYWFNAGRQTSSDSGEIIIGQQHAYVWLNKGIINNSITLPAGVGLDLLDERTSKLVFSSKGNTWQAPARKLKWNELTLESNHVYLARPTNIGGLTAVASAPMSLYMQSLAASIALFMALAGVLIKVTLKLHVRYFSLPAKLRYAINSDKLDIRYQPIVDMNTKQWIGAEALLRCTLNGQNVSPNILIPMAQRAGLMSQLTRRVCIQVAEDHASLIWACTDFYITINLSAEDILDETFPEFTKNLFDHYRVQSTRIIFEITEESLADKSKAIVNLKKLREQGHQIAIDDFGTGYSSLSNLGSLPVDILKIDRSFITLDKLKHHDGLWWHIISMARVHGLKIVVEGVETQQQAKILSSAGIIIGQGWFYSKDLSASNLAKGFFSVEYTRLC